jgi:hypothetical protein
MENKKNSKIDLLSYLGVLVLSFVVSLQSNSNIFVYREQGVDSAVFQYVAKMMKLGFLPYKDTFDHKGPLLYLIDLAGLSVNEKWGIWLVELVFLSVTFIFMYKSFRLWAGRLISLFVLLISFSPFGDYFYGGNFSEEYSLPFIAVSLYIFLDYFKNDKINDLRLIACGFSFGAVMLLRANNAGLWPAMCLFVLIYCFIRKDLKPVVRYICMFLIGIAVILVPISVWLFSKGIFSDFIDCYLGFNMLYSKSGFLTKLNGIKLFLSDPPVSLSVIICLFFALKNKSYKAFGYVALILAVLAFISLPEKVYTHYGIVIIPVIMCPYAVLFSNIKKEKISLINGLKYVIALFSAVLILTPTSFSLYERAVYDLSHVGEEYYPETYEYVVAFTDYYTGKDDRVIYFGNCNRYYLLTDRLSASRFSYQSPIFDTSAELGWSDEFFDTLKSDPPKLIGVLTERANICDRDRMTEFLDSHGYKLVLVTDDIYMYVREVS